jgi:hypothetical protein
MARHRGEANLALVIVIVVILVLVAFFIGHTYRGAGTSAATTTPAAATTTAAAQPSDYYSNTASWQSATNDKGGFTISYPLDFATDNSSSVTPSTDWRTDSQDPGTLAFTLTVPSAFEPQTNFADAKLTVGYSANDTAIKNCYAPLPSATAAATTTQTINSITYMVTTGSDAGAGNLYDTTSYRTMHAGKCYAVEYTIHSSELGNYPASYNLSAFDEQKVMDVLDRVVATLSFN